MQRLSTLVSSVLSDATTGVTDAERRATEARHEVRSSLAQPPSELVDEADIDRAIQQAAPGLEEPPESLLRGALPQGQVERYIDSWETGATAVRRGEVFLHPRFVGTEHATRFEGLERTFGVEVDPTDLAFRGGVPFLTDTAVQAIRETVAEEIGRRRKETLAALGEYGFPRPVVEHMDLDVKLAFDETLRVRPVDAGASGDVLPEAIGGIDARIHFESEGVG